MNPFISNHQALVNRDGIPIEQAKLLDEFHGPRLCRNSRPDEVGMCAWSPDGQYFAWSCGHRIVKIILWTKYRNWKNEKNATGRTAEFPGVIVIDAGEQVRSLCLGSKSVNGKGRRTERERPRDSFHLFVVHDVFLVTGLGNGRIRMWDIKSGCLLGELIDHSACVCDLSFSPTGMLRLLSASVDGSLKLWDMEDDGNLQKTLCTRSKAVFGCCWSPSGRMIASVGDYRSVLIWDVEHFRIIWDLVGHQHSVCKCSFSPDGALLATCSFDTCVIVWDVAGGAALQRLRHLLPPPSVIFAGGSNGSCVRCLSFSSDGIHLGTVCDDGFFRLWDLSDSKFPVQAASVDGVCCQFSPDGAVLAVGTLQGKALLWNSAVKVPSLQHFCRLSIRRHFPLSTIVGLCLLPKRLQQFLRYDHAF